MPNFCHVTIVGHIGRDPELREAGGEKVCDFSVAVTRKRKDEEQTQWYRATAWRGLAETCAKYLKKGQAVLVSGNDLEVREFTGKDGKRGVSLEFQARDVQFLSRKEDGAAPSKHETADGDEIPF